MRGSRVFFKLEICASMHEGHASEIARSAVHN